MPSGQQTPALDHEAMLLAVVRHQDDVAVGRPDEPGQAEGVVRAGRGGLHRRHLVGFDAAQLRGRVQHADASQQRGVHLGGYGDTRAHASLTEPSPFPAEGQGRVTHTSGTLSATYFLLLL